MKLIFTKKENNDINVQLVKGTIVEDFTYTEMIKQLLKKNTFEDTEFNDISEDEKQRINSMLQKVNSAVLQDIEEKE
jgi:hypothetical protein